jgi:hypothetical protein
MGDFMDGNDFLPEWRCLRPHPPEGAVRGEISEDDPRIILWFDAEDDVLLGWYFASEQDARDRLAKHQLASGPVVDLVAYRARSR